MNEQQKHTSMANATANNKRIAKNTLFLYVRMFVTLGVSLFTVRIVLQTLGVEDYGIYNVVAGFVTSFSFIANTTSSAIQRFLSYCLGQNDKTCYHEYFVGSFILFVALALTAFILLETVGGMVPTRKNGYPIRENGGCRLGISWCYDYPLLLVHFDSL